MYDVLVAGAGPAGSAAAYELGKAGFRVLMLERYKMPRYKACGGAIPLNFFKTLPLRAQKTQVSILKNLTYLGPNGSAHSAGEAVEIAAVMREDFDHAFALSAVDEGCELIDASPLESFQEHDDRVVVQTKRGSFEARYLIGADGATGIIRCRAGLGQRISSAAAMEVEIAPRVKINAEEKTLIHFTFVRDGYAWVFPKGPIDSLGILSYDRDKSIIKKKLAGWASFCGYSLDNFVIHGHPIPRWNGKCALATQRIFLAGDAAGTADPLGGEGIRHAIRSGRLAADRVNRALTGKDISDDYTDVLYRHIHKDFEYAGRIAAFFYRFPTFCYKTAVTRIGTRLICQILYGKSSFEELYRRSVRKLLNPANYLKAALQILQN